MTANGVVYPFVVDLVKRRVPERGTVLELGCGAMQYEPLLPGRYLGLDLPSSPYLRRRPHILRSAEAVPLEDDSVDVVFGVGAFYLMEPIQAVFSECRRILRPGGRLLVFDYQKHVLAEFARQGDDSAVHVWSARELRGQISAAGFERRHIHDISHRAGSTGDPRLLRRPLRRIRYAVSRTWTQWLVVEARA